MLSRSSRRFLILLLTGLSCGILAAGQQTIHINNFGQVNDHLFRGAEPPLAALEELAKMHIVLDLDLREAGAGTEAEKNAAERLGIKYVNVPLRPLSGPTRDEMKRILSLIYQDDMGRMFVHCRRGRDRTGTVIACYRIEHDGWDNRKAAQEAAQYGMSWMQRGMRSFIYEFKAIDLPAPLQAAK